MQPRQRTSERGIARPAARVHRDLRVPGVRSDRPGVLPVGAWLRPAPGGTPPWLGIVILAGGVYLLVKALRREPTTDGPRPGSDPHEAPYRPRPEHAIRGLGLGAAVAVARFLIRG